MHPIFKAVMEILLEVISPNYSVVQHSIVLTDITDTTTKKTPDFVFFQNKIEHFCYVMFVAELLRGSSNETAHKGKIVTYNRQVLKRNRLRQSVISVLIK